MSNITRLGRNDIDDKQWGVNTGALLVSVENGVSNELKPVDFSVTRGSKATRVNKLGFIELVDINVPRIDFLNNRKGLLLGENQSTNSLPYSENFNTNAYTILNMTNTPDSGISPDGKKTASILTTTSTFPQMRMTRTVSVGNNTLSIFAKYIDSPYIVLRSRDFTNGVNTQVWFDIQNGTIGGSDGDTPISTSMEDYGNGWYRCSISFIVNSSDTNGNLYVYLCDTNLSYDNTIGRKAYLWGSQLENLDSLTSYIPTYGSSVSRNKDFISKNGSSNLIGQTEGTIYMEFYHKTTIGYKDFFSIWNSSVKYLFRIRIISNTFNVVYNGASSAKPLVNDVTLIPNQINKVSIKYDYITNSSSIFVNGTKMNTVVGADPYPTETQAGINVGAWFGVPEMNLRQLTLYKTQLSDSELESLTEPITEIVKLPRISGDVFVGTTLNVQPGDWSTGVNGTVSSTYIWQRSADNINWSDINGTTDTLTYTISQIDLNKLIRVSQTITDGTTTQTLPSFSTTKVPEITFDNNYQGILDYAISQADSLPDMNTRILQNQVIIDLKSSGVFNKLDFMHVWRDGTTENSGFKSIDWIRLNKATLVNSPTIGINGIQGDRVSSYVDLNYNPTTNGSNFLLNDHSFGAYNANPSSNGALISSFGAGTYLEIQTDNTNARIITFDSNTLGDVTSVGSNTQNKHFLQQRLVSTNYQTYLNNTQLHTPNRTSVSLPNVNFRLFAREGGSSYGDGIVSYDFGGAGLTSTERQSIINAFENYFKSL